MLRAYCAATFRRGGVAGPFRGAAQRKGIKGFRAGAELTWGHAPPLGLAPQTIVVQRSQSKLENLGPTNQPWPKQTCTQATPNRIRKIFVRDQPATIRVKTKVRSECFNERRHAAGTYAFHALNRQTLSAAVNGNNPALTKNIINQL